MATLSGMVRDSNGILVGDVTVSAYDKHGHLVSEDTTGSDGQSLGIYRLAHLFEGQDYGLDVTVGDATRNVGEVSVTSQQTIHDIDLGAPTETVTSVTSATTVTSATSDSSDTGSSSTDSSSSSVSSDTSSSSTTDSSTSSSTSDTSSSSTTDSSTSSVSSDTSSSTTSSSSTTDSSSSSVSSDTSSSTSSSSSSVSSDTSSSSSSSLTSTTSATTVSITITLAPDPEFTALQALITDPVFAITPPVNIEEARQARNLMTVGFYLRAGVPQAIASLNSILAGGNSIALNLINKTDLLTRYQNTIKNILDRRNENTFTENEALVQMRKQFNQGLESAEDVNRDFPTIYRQLINLVADDLMGVTPQQFDNNVVFDATQRERLFNFLRRLKASMIGVTESLSFAGSLGTVVLISKWSGILRSALAIIQTVGQSYVASDNVDEKHWVSVLSVLINRPVADNRPYLVHSREGGQLLSDVISVYEKITQQDGLEKEDESFIRSLFYTSGNVFTNPNQTVVERLKENGRLLRDNWPTNFGA